MQKLARQVMGTHNIDHCARLCHASTVAGLTMAFGSGAMSNSMNDVAEHCPGDVDHRFEHDRTASGVRDADSPSRAAPRGERGRGRSPQDRYHRVCRRCISARGRERTWPCSTASCIIVLQNGWQDQKFIDERCEGFEEFRATVEKYSPEACRPRLRAFRRRNCYQAAEILARHKPMASSGRWASRSTRPAS